VVPEVSEHLSTETQPKPAQPHPQLKESAVILFSALVAMGVLIGTAAHLPLPVFLTAAAAITAWLLGFGAREGIARLRHR
jgi:hypothetical protein